MKKSKSFTVQTADGTSHTVPTMLTSSVWLVSIVGTVSKQVDVVAVQTSQAASQAAAI